MYVSAVAQARIVWVTFDTPVDEDDQANVDFVASHIRAIFPALAEGTLVLISSQVPVGFTAQMEAEYLSRVPRAGTSRSRILSRTSAWARPLMLFAKHKGS